jgi:hypothetical protein
LKKISINFVNLYKRCPQSVDLSPLLYFSGSATTSIPDLFVGGLCAYVRKRNKGAMKREKAEAFG